MLLFFDSIFAPEKRFKVLTERLRLNLNNKENNYNDFTI